LTLTGGEFSITDTAVTAGSYGSASQTLTATVNAQGQLTALAATSIAITNTQVSGLGTMSTQNANNVNITGGSISGITDLAITDGGTGASTAAGARTNLGLGSAAVQNDSRYAHRANNLSDLDSAATARTNLGLGTISTQNANNVNITGGLITGLTTFDNIDIDGGTF
jgi:hypothetical protein